MTRLQGQLVTALQAHLDGAAPAPPLAGRMIWQTFVGLSEARRYDDGLPLPITQGEVLAVECRGRARWPGDMVAILLAMDRAWLAHVRDRLANPDKARVPLTAAGFDAMFA